jgi:transposase
MMFFAMFFFLRSFAMGREDFRRHDLSDVMWARLKPYLPSSKGNRGRRAQDNRLFLNAVLWILRTGSPIFRFYLARFAV